MSKIDILTYLSRNDKWYLGGGSSLIWAPTHPRWLDVPGFWDGAHHFSYEFQPVFTITLLDDKERVLVPKFRSREWNPAFLTQQYQTGGKIDIIEKKALLPSDSLVSELTFKNNSTVPRILHLVMWTSQRTLPSQDGGTLADAVRDGKRITFTKEISTGDSNTYPLICCFGTTGEIESYGINMSQSVPNLPHWEYTPFYEKFRNGRLPGEKKVHTLDDDGLLYMALHTSFTLNPHARKTVLCAATIAQEKKMSQAGLSETLRAKNPLQLSIQNWRTFFDEVPYFECSDPHVQKYYWYRWYGLKLNAILGQAGVIEFPAICEGPGSFHIPISYSAQAHMRETRWMNTGTIAQSCLLNFVRNQREGGDYPGHLFPHGVPEDAFYHANWGESVSALHSLHPDRSFLDQAYHSLVHYVDYFDRERDREGSGLYDVINHYETGQEYSNRYTAIHEQADSWEWGDRFRLKGVDASVYIYDLKRSLAAMAHELDRDEDKAKWVEKGDRIKQAILKFMWDPGDQVFYDVNPKTMERTMVKAITCFYPYMTDIVDERHIPGLKLHLLNPEEFWTPFPAATISRDDPLFNAEAEWKGMRHRCPWNGRVWPMTNSHMVEVLANVAMNVDQSLRPHVVELMTKFIHMMFMKNDLRYPNCYEHYNPVSGLPCLFRGVNDYQHSWVVDLILKYIAGIQPRPDGSLVIHPFPFDIQRIRVDRIPFRGHLLRVEIEDEHISVSVDEISRTSGKRGDTIEVPVEPE